MGQDARRAVDLTTRGDVWDLDRNRIGAARKDILANIGAEKLYARA